MNVAWRSKTLAVDYIMLDEREKPNGNPEVMDYVCSLLFGSIDGETLATY